jgi:glycosyltransferase involved in cell wall biosynthesis
MTPRVSIGLPVYNGEQFLPTAIDSILAQDFGDFELIIADNASTDRTSEIASKYAARDERISIHASDVNRGAAWNFNRCVHLARGHYFKWVAHDDELETIWLSRCVQIMDQEPDVVLCYSRTLQIDADGAIIRELPSWSALDESPRRRVSRALLSMSNATAMFGLTRRAELLRTRLERSYGASDRALIAQLALMGKLHEVPQFLFRNREYNERSGGAVQDRRMRDAFVDPTRNARWSLPRWQLLGGYTWAFVTAPVPFQTRAAGLSVLPTWILRQKGNLAYDFVRLLKPLDQSAVVDRSGGR